MFISKETEITENTLSEDDNSLKTQTVEFLSIVAPYSSTPPQDDSSTYLSWRYPQEGDDVPASIEAGELNFRTYRLLSLELEDRASLGDFIVVESEDQDADAEQHIGSGNYIKFWEVSPDRFYVELDDDVESSQESVSTDYYGCAGIWIKRNFTNDNFDLNDVIDEGLSEVERPGSYFDSQWRPNKNATIYVAGLNGVEWFGTSNFVLQGVQKVFKEKTIPVSSMEGTTVRFSCSPKGVFRFSGSLLNTPTYDWSRNWWYNWDNYMKGSMTARNLCRIVLIYNGKIITGYMLSFNNTQSVQSQPTETLTFDIYVSKYQTATPTTNIIGESYINSAATLSDAIAGQAMSEEEGGG